MRISLTLHQQHQAISAKCTLQSLPLRDTRTGLFARRESGVPPTVCRARRDSSGPLTTHVVSNKVISCELLSERETHERSWRISNAMNAWLLSELETHERSWRVSNAMNAWPRNFSVIEGFLLCIRLLSVLL